MTIDTLRGLLLWSGIINYGLLIVWVLAYLLARESLHRIARWFGLSNEVSDAMNYGGMMLYKLAIFFFFLVPYVALRIVG
jgi:hypothetical protein